MPTDTIPGSFVAAVTLLGFSWLPDENPELAREFGLRTQRDVKLAEVMGGDE